MVVQSISSVECFELSRDILGSGRYTNLWQIARHAIHMHVIADESSQVRMRRWDLSQQVLSWQPTKMAVELITGWGWKCVLLGPE